LRIRCASLEIVINSPPLSGNAAGVIQLGQRNGQPCSHKAKRKKGPNVRV